MASAVNHSLAAAAQAQPIATNSTAQLEKAVASITAEQIDVMGKSIIIRIMSCLNISIKKYPTDSEFSPVMMYAAQAIPGSKLFKILLPAVTKKLTETISLPQSFLTEGARIDLITQDKTGLIDLIDDASLRMFLEENIADFNKNSMTDYDHKSGSQGPGFTYSLVCLGASSFGDQQLCIEMHDYINGNKHYTGAILPVSKFDPSAAEKNIFGDSPYECQWGGDESQFCSFGYQYENRTGKYEQLKSIAF